MTTYVGRRDFIAILGGVVAWPLGARAQQQVRRVGVLGSGTEARAAAGRRAFEERLQELGWTKEKNLRIDYRAVGSNDPELTRPYAAELVGLAPDVLVANAHPPAEALHRLTRAIPIVFNISGDPVRAGFVQSLARPGGNMTGFFQFEATFNTKYLQLLKDIAPQVTRVAVVQAQGSLWRGDFAAVEAVARSFAVTPVTTLIRDDAADVERAIVAFAREPNGGLIVPPDATTTKHRELIVGLAAKHRLPAIYSNREWVDAGGLMSYDSSSGFQEIRGVAVYVDRILRGAKPGDLPVQAPTRFELIISLRAATAMGLTIPTSLFALADEVIE
jgi:putative ABC transport system substrate-binding protein